MFNELNIKSIYCTYSENIAEEFYIPILQKAIQYDRASAYFSAKSLANYSEGLEIFARKENKFRLIISTQITEEDFNEIKRGYELKKTISDNLLSKFDEILNLREKKNLSNLAYLISIGIVEIKMAFTQKGIFHDKFGIFKDSSKNLICFRGSNNETKAAFDFNYESFDVTCSWLASSFDLNKITQSVNTFDKLWNNKNDNVVVKALDSVIRNKILEFNKGEIIKEYAILENDCVILDFNNNKLKLIIRINLNTILLHPIYKLRLKMYVNQMESRNNIIIFNKELTYPTYKKIINLLQKDSEKRNYKFITTNRLLKYIKERELNILERARVGLSIKAKDQLIIDKYYEFKKIADKEMSRLLREKQVWDSFFMYTMKKVSNFSVPGSGKTASALGVFSVLHYQNKIDKIVMIGPKNSFESWISEFKISFANKKKLKCLNIQEHNNLVSKKYALRYEIEGKNLVLLNYECLDSVRDILSNLINEKTLLVYDEIHKVKKINGKRAKDAITVSRNAKYIIGLTGTPIPNSYADIYNLLDILFHDEYNEYFDFSISDLEKPTKETIEKINNSLQPFYCRTTKLQLDVPKANSDIILPSYSSHEENEIYNILILAYRNNKLALIIRLLQLESNPKMLLKSLGENGENYSDILDINCEIEDIKYKDFSDEIQKLINKIDKTQKFKKCLDIVLKLYNKNEQIIIWCIFINSINKLAEELTSKGLKVGIITGKISYEERQNILLRFKNNELDVLITNPHTLAESVSLHKTCHTAIYFEYSYNLVHLLQSKDRIHRLGLPIDQQTQYYFCQNNFTNYENKEISLDNNIYKRLLEKEQIMLNAIENNELEISNVSEDDINLILNDI